MSDVIILDREAKEKILRGVQKLAKSVGVALGPFEKNAILLSQDGFVSQTRDPKLIAKIVSSFDPLEQFGIDFAKESLQFDPEALILTEGIFREGLQALFRGKDSVCLKKELEKLLKPLGKIFDEMSAEKEIRVDEYTFNGGVISPYFLTNPKEMTSELEEPYMYLTNQKLKSIEDVLPILESVSHLKDASILILAEDVYGEALDLLVVNHLKGKLKIGVAKQENDLQELALLTKAKIVQKNFDKSFLGRAKKVVISSMATRIEVTGVLERRVLPGYGLSYIRAIEKLKLEEAKRESLEILEKAFLQPLKVIAENAHMNPEIVLKAVLEGENDFGLFPEKGIFAPLLSLGITDSLEDIKRRVVKAITTASSLLMIETIVTSNGRSDPKWEA